MAVLAQTSKLIVILVLIVAVFAVLFGVMVGTNFQLVNLDTTTKTANAYGFQAYGGQAAEQLLDASLYVTSWKTDLQSEKIVISGDVARNFGTLACLKEYRYRVYTSANALTWTEIPTSPYVFAPGYAWTVNSRVDLQAIAITITGPFEGALRADLEFHVIDPAEPFCNGFDRGWLWVGQDQAYLKSGIGSVTAPAQAQIGDTISVTVRVAYVQSEQTPGKGWFLVGYSSASDVVVLQVDVTQLVQSFPYTVKGDDFAVSATCRNELTWVLRNELWEKDFTTTTTIDASAFAPSVTITGIEGDRVVGSQVTVRWTASPNPITDLNLTKIIIKYGFGGPDTEEVLSPDVAFKTLTPGQGGTLHFEVIAYDSGCRPSPTAGVDIGIRDPQYEGTPLGLNLIVFALILAGAVVLAAVVAALAPGPMALKVGLFLLIVLGGAYAAFKFSGG